MEQGSIAWHEARLGKVTASNFAKAIARVRSGDGFSETANSYMYELIGERLTGQWEEVTSKALEWGKEWEPVARKTYASRFAVEVEQVPFVALLDDTLQGFVGASPDGILSDGATLEIKCPLTYREHARALVTRKMPVAHRAQVQGQMWVCGSGRATFVSFHPAYRKPHDLVVVDVPRDDKYIDETLAPRITEFVDRLNAECARFINDQIVSS